jgi:hypothetical protein
MRWATLSKLYRPIAFAIVLASPSAAKGASAYIQVSPTHGTVIYEEQPLNAVVSVTPSGGGYDATRFGGSVSYVDKNGALIGLGYASGYAAGAWSSPMGANVQLAGIAAPGLYELKFEGLVEHLGYFDYLNPQAVWGRPENFSTTVTVEVFEQPLADPNTTLSNVDNTKNAQISVSNGTFSGAPVDTRTIQTRICQFFTTGSQQVFFDSIVIRDRNDADAPIYYVRLQGTSLNRLLKRGQNVGKYYTEYAPFADEGRILLQPNTEYAVVMEPYAVPPFTATFEATSDKLNYRTTLGWTLGRTETVTADSGGYDPGGGYDPIYVPPSSSTTVSPAAPFFSISATPTGGYDGFPLEGAASLHPFNPATAANWSAGGAEWSVNTTTTHDGVDSVKAQTANGQSTYREYTVTGPKVVDFWWKVSSEQIYDTFSYSLNGVNQETISGEVDWSYRTLTLPAGTHTIRWTYAKDASDAVGQDAGWLDDFAVYPATPTLRVRDGSTVLNGTVTVDFGDADIGSSGFTKTLNFANEGYVPQEVELSLPPSSPFTFEGGSSTYVTLIGRGESVNVPIYLATQSTGTKTALLSISALNSTAAPPQVTLTGDVRGPVVGVSLGSTTLTSGQTVDMGLAPKILEFTIRNNGNTGNLTPQVSATGNFQIVQQPAASVAPQGSTTFKVMAQSGVFGSQTGSVVVTSNDGFTPTFTINLTSKVFFGIGSGISEGSVATSGTSGASGWDFATTQLPSGSTGQAIKTGVTPDNGKSHLQAIFNGAGLLRWKWKLSAQEGFDWLACEVSNPASNSTYLDSLRDDSLSGTGGTIDIVSMSIDETTDHLIFAITVNGNTAAYGGNGGPLYFIAIATGEGANVFDKFNVSTPLGRTTHYISTVIYGGTLAQAWISNSSEGIPVELVTGPQTTLRYMVRKTLLNYKRGNSFYFDAYSAWQDEFGGNRFAMDSLSNPQVASGETYTSTPEKGISRYPRGGEVASLSTKNSVWREQVVYVPAGGCVKWTYRKDGSAAVGEDAGYIADLVFEPFEAPLSYSDWWRQFQQPSTNTNIQTIFTTNCVVTAVGPAFITNCYVMPISITNVTVSYPDPPHPQAPMSRSGLPALMSWVGGFNPDSVPDSSHYRILQDGSQQKFRFPISKRYSGGSVSAEFTPSLTNNWSGAGVRQTLHSQDANTVIIEATPPAGASNGFMRLNVR